MTIDCEDNLSAGMFDFGEGFGGPVREDFVGGFLWNVVWFWPGFGLQCFVCLSVLKPYLVFVVDREGDLLGIAKWVGSQLRIWLVMVWKKPG
jgi:hypothetical protein